METFKKEAKETKTPQNNQEQSNQADLYQQEVALLQDNGIFRLKLLATLESNTNALNTLNQTIIDGVTEVLTRLDGTQEEPVEDNENLPPLPTGVQE